MKLAALVLALFVAAPASALADRGSVAILPITAGEARHALYTRPIAGVIAAGLARATGARVDAVPVGQVPKTAIWIVDGRIVARGKHGVAIEARLRDPTLGRAAGTVVTRARPLREVDRLVDELTGELASLYATAEAVRLTPPPAPPPPASPRSVAAPSRPRLLVGPVATPAGVAIDALAPAGRLSDRLGLTLATGGPAGRARPDIVAALAHHRADLALVLEVVELDVVPGAVVTGRAVVRAAAFDPSGRRLYDRLLSTDTLVGERGDRGQALLHHAVEQAVDIALPELRRALPRRLGGGT